MKTKQYRIRIETDKNDKKWYAAQVKTFWGWKFLLLNFSGTVVFINPEVVVSYETINECYSLINKHKKQCNQKKSTFTFEPYE